MRVLMPSRLGRYLYLTIANYLAVWVSINASSGTFSPCWG